MSRFPCGTEDDARKKPSEHFSESPGIAGAPVAHMGVYTIGVESRYAGGMILRRAQNKFESRQKMAGFR